MANHSTTSSTDSSSFEMVSVDEDKFELVGEPTRMQVRLCSMKYWDQTMTFRNLEQYVALDPRQIDQYTDLLLDEPFPRPNLLELVTLPGYKPCAKLDKATVDTFLKPDHTQTPVVTELSLIGHSLTTPELVELLREVGDNLTHLTLEPSLDEPPFQRTKELWDVIGKILKNDKFTHLSVAFDHEYFECVRSLYGRLSHLSTYPFGYSGHSEEKWDMFSKHFPVLSSLGLDLSPRTPDSVWGPDFEHTISTLTIDTPVEKEMLEKIASTFKKIQSLDITISSGPQMDFGVCFDHLYKMKKLNHLMLRSNAAHYGGRGTDDDRGIWFEYDPIRLLSSVKSLALKMYIRPLSFSTLISCVPNATTVFVDQCSYVCYCTGWALDDPPLLPIVGRSVGDDTKSCKSCFNTIHKVLLKVRDRKNKL